MSKNVQSITPNKRRAIQALLTSRTQAEAAEKINVNEKTIGRWLQDDSFLFELNKAETGLLDANSRHLLSLQFEAIETLADVMRNGEAKDAQRRLASLDIVRFMYEAFELRTVSRRIDLLEKHI